MNARCNLVFTGRIAPGLDPSRVIDRLVRILDLPPKTAADLVGAGRPRLVRRNIDQAVAERLRQQLSAIGLLMRIQPLAEAPPGGAAPAPTAGSQATRASAALGPDKRCPKCGSTRVANGLCADCGLLTELYMPPNRTATENSGPSAGAASAQDARPVPGAAQSPAPIPRPRRTPTRINAGSPAQRRIDQAPAGAPPVRPATQSQAARALPAESPVEPQDSPQPVIPRPRPTPRPCALSARGSPASAVRPGLVMARSAPALAAPTAMDARRWMIINGLALSALILASWVWLLQPVPDWHLLLAPIGAPILAFAINAAAAAAIGRSGATGADRD